MQWLLGYIYSSIIMLCNVYVDVGIVLHAAPDAIYCTTGRNRSADTRREIVKWVLETAEGSENSVQRGLDRLRATMHMVWW